MAKQELAMNFIVTLRPKNMVFSLEEADAKAKRMLEGDIHSEQVYIYQLVGSYYKSTTVQIDAAAIKEKEPSIGELDEAEQDDMRIAPEGEEDDDGPLDLRGQPARVPNPLINALRHRVLAEQEQLDRDFAAGQDAIVRAGDGAQ